MRTTEVQTTEELGHRIHQFAKRKVDIVERSSNAYMLNDGETVRVTSGSDVQEGRMSNLALNQFGLWSRMGTTYPNRLRKEIVHAKEMVKGTQNQDEIKKWENECQEHRRILASNVNHWFRHRDTDRMFRFFKSEDIYSYPNELRSFNSSQYKRVDNDLIWDAVVPVITRMVEDEDLEVGSIFVNETGMHGKFLLPKLEGELFEGKVVRGGFRVRNSEVGEGRYLIEPFVLVLACLNGMVVHKYEKGVRGIHKGKRQHAGVLDQYGDLSDVTSIEYTRFKKDIGETVSQCVSQGVFEGFLDQARDARRGERIRNHSNISPAKPWMPSVDLIGEDYHLGRLDRVSIDQSLVRSGDFSKWGMSQAITEPANNQEMAYEQSSRLEEIGGIVLAMNDTNWHRIAAYEAPRLAA